MSGYRAAGLFRRGLSVLIDASVGITIVGLLYVVGVLDAVVFRPDAAWFWTEWWLLHWLDDPRIFIDPVVTLAVSTWLWVLIWEGLSGRTPGDRLAKIEVVDGDGDPPGWRRVLARGVVVWLNIITFGLGWMWAFVSPDRRALHDVVSDTWVIRAS